MLWRPPRRSWCMHRILCTACNRNSTRSFERGHDGNILEEAYRGRYARQRLLNFWPESSCGYHAIKRFVCIIQVEAELREMDIVICDDMQAELADFIVADTRHRRVAFIHAKAFAAPVYLSASALSVVCAQAVKNLEYLHPYTVRVPENVERW